MAEQTDWLETLEIARPDFLEAARTAAVELLQTQDEITIDDVRAVCPPPDSVDPRVMGAVFKVKGLFVGTGRYVNSKRPECHKRPVQLFCLVA